MTEFTRELMYGKRPIHRTNPQPGQSEWYYLDPRGTDRFADMKQIDVPSEDSPNPYANEIQNYLYENDEYNYKQLYGDNPPPVLDQPNYGITDYTVNTESLVDKPSSYFQNNTLTQTSNNSQDNNMNFNSSNSTDIPRYWETAADGKKVYDYMMQQEGNFTQPIQRPELYQYSAFSAVPNMIQNYFKLKPLNVTDKYKHAYMNCSAAQYGQGGADMATLASNLREWYDKKSGANTLDSSEGDQYANRIGRFLGSKYPEEDCDELIQRYIKRRY